MKNGTFYQPAELKLMMKVNNMSTALALDMLNFNILVSIFDLFVVVYLDDVERDLFLTKQEEASGNGTVPL